MGEAAPELEAALAVQPDPLAAAFFDLDNTILRGASLFYLARGLYRRQFFTARDVARFAWQQTRFVIFGESHDLLAVAEAQSLQFIAGHSVEELRAIGDEIFLETMADKVWPGTHGLARLHLEAGQRVWLVTASPQEVAARIAAHLGLTGAMGTVVEQVDGVYTGRLAGPIMHGAAKVETVLAVAEREGLDLARCSAYSDSSNDIPLLSLVGHPCAINPDRRLRAYARDHGWRVKDYRTRRRAIRFGLLGAAALGAAVGAAAGIAAVTRHPRKH
jgi:HAD superfamily hydrolase (TIGR01490 family)